MTAPEQAHQHTDRSVETGQENILTGSSRDAVDEHLTEAMEAYLAELEAGQQPNRAEYLARYPDIAEELSRCLHGLDFVHQAAPQLSESGSKPHGRSAGEIRPLSTLGDYRIVREIGRGGMGVVYEAQQLSLNRRVALKVLPYAAVLDPRQLQRFKNEAMAAASLDHPGIVHVHAVGCERGVHFYAMQFIEGNTLSKVIEHLKKPTQPVRSASKDSHPDPVPSTLDPQLPPDTGPIAALSTEHSVNSVQSFRSAARIGIEVAEALDYAHQQGVIHRDIKPSNLMIDAQGKIWITDFGLAQIETNTELTMTGDVIGTLRYISPEQATGKSGFVDHRADIYSLGATLYELLTLQPVFPGTHRHELLHQVTNDEPTAPRKLNSAIPAELEAARISARCSRMEVNRNMSCRTCEPLTSIAN